MFLRTYVLRRFLISQISFLAQAARHIGLQSHASWIDTLLFWIQYIYKVAHLKENTIILLENKTKTP